VRCSPRHAWLPLLALGLAAGCTQPQQAPPPPPPQPAVRTAANPNPTNFVAVQYLVLEPNADPQKPCQLSVQDPSNPDEKTIHTGQGKNVMWMLENNCALDATLTFDFGTNHPLVRIPKRIDKQGLKLATGDLQFVAARIRNALNVTFPHDYPYTVTVLYNGKTYVVDPDIIIEF
jgi:hypothetical protein